MKKVFSLFMLMLIVASVFLTACGTGGNGGNVGDNANKESSENNNNNDDNAAEPEIGEDIDTQESLNAIMEKLREVIDESVFVPKTFDSLVTADTCQSMTGLTVEQFEKYVTDGYSMTAMIMTQAFEITMVKCKDYASAAEVKKLIKDGYDSLKWICVFPEQTFVVDSGRFVLIGAVYNDVAEALQQSFADQFTTKAGDVNKFYDGGVANSGGDVFGEDIILY